ncbi:MAG: PQQ-binding-like beta-propeller repeat protein [Steroidobacteraceae bacterium]
MRPWERLGLAWEFQPGTNRGMEATPIVVDGVMYTSGVAGRVYALDAATGHLLWKFEPPLKLKNARGSCCDIVNRGVAVWQGKVYVGSFEGILYALDAQDGRVLWQTDTFVDHSRAYSITGAPQVAGSVVVIGNGGAEFDSRGYVSAFDLQTGKLCLALLHRARGSLDTLREQRTRDGGQNLGSEARLEGRRRRQRLGWYRLRCEAEPGLLRHLQWRALEQPAPQSQRWRQPLHCLHRRAACR